MRNGERKEGVRKKVEVVDETRIQLSYTAVTIS
jgi:hypothetical protein